MTDPAGHPPPAAQEAPGTATPVSDDARPSIADLAGRRDQLLDEWTRTLRIRATGRVLDRVDFVVGSVVMYCSLAAIGAWIAFSIVPQYLVFLIAGALPRAALASSVRSYFLPSSTAAEVIRLEDGASAPEGAIHTGLTAAPVTVTLAFSSLLLWMVNRWS